MPSAITDVLWWINSEVDKLSASALPRVEEILGAAQAELAHDLSRAKWLGTDDKYTAQVHRNAMSQIESALDHIKRETGPDFEETIKLGTIRAGRLAAAHVVSEVEKFSSIYEGTVRPVALEAMAVLAEGKKTLWPRHKNSAARYAGDVGRDIRKQLGIGVIKGETIDQLTNRLSRHGGPRGVVYTRGREGSPNARAEMISEGLFKRYRYWGERLARTELVNAYNECALIGMDELEADDPGYFKRWDAAIDGRLCLLCREFDDLVVPLNKSFPGGFDKPPRHPNCRCACVIWRKEWDEADHKDDLMMPIAQGKEPGSIASVPHRIQTPEPKPAKPVRDDSAFAKRGRRVPGLPETASHNLVAQQAPKKVKVKKAIDAETLEKKKALKQESQKGILKFNKMTETFPSEWLSQLLDDDADLAADAKNFGMSVPKYKSTVQAKLKKKLKQEEKQKAKQELVDAKANFKTQLKDQASLILGKSKDTVWLWDSDDLDMIAENAKIPVSKLKSLLAKEVQAQRIADNKAEKLIKKQEQKALKSGKLPKDQLFVLPPPTKGSHSEAERAAYRKEAESEIADSRHTWDAYTRRKGEYVTSKTEPGMTYSQKEFVAIREKYAEKLTPEQRDAALYYSHMGDRVLNSSLRENLFDKASEAEVREKAKHLDSAIREHRVTQDTYVARGMSGHWADKVAASIKPGDVFEESGYISTAATTPFSGDLVMRIRIPKGAHAAPIPSRYPNEDEYLLPRGSQFRVLSVTKINGRTEMEVEVVTDEKTKPKRTSKSKSSGEDGSGADS